MNKAILIIVVIILVIIIGGYFLIKGSYQGTVSPQAPTGLQTETPTPTPIPTPTPVPAPIPTPTPTTVPEPSVKEISVSGTEFKFDPSSITLKAGERVKMNFRNDGQAPHNLTIEGLNIKTKTIRNGESDTIKFTAPASGTYSFFCSVPGHRAKGMEGSLKVE